MSNNTGRFFEGVIVGGILGYLFGMFSAPKPGYELRKQIVDGSEDLYKQATDSICDLKEALSDLQSKSEGALKKAATQFNAKKQQLATSSHHDLKVQGQAMAEDSDSISSS